MGEDNEEIIVFEILAYDVLLQMLATDDGKFHITVGVEDVDTCEICKSMFLGCAQMCFCSVTVARIRSITLDKGAIDETDEVGDKSRVEMIGFHRLTCGYLDADVLTFSLSAEGFVDLDDILRSDVLDVIDGWDGIGRVLGDLIILGGVGAAGGAENQSGGRSDGEDVTDSFH